MNYYQTRDSCLQCNAPIDEKIKHYSITHFDFPLCLKCQDWYKIISAATSPETLQLYFALKKRKVPAEIEKFDGYKTIDIAITNAKVNIEVDGQHHNFNPKQALADLQRTYYSFKKGYLTFRIPNSLVRFHLDETADTIISILKENKGKLRSVPA